MNREKRGERERRGEKEKKRKERREKEKKKNETSVGEHAIDLFILPTFCVIVS